jgi:hypothetical protein
MISAQYEQVSSSAGSSGFLSITLERELFKTLAEFVELGISELVDSALLSFLSFPSFLSKFLFPQFDLLFKLF